MRTLSPGKPLVTVLMPVYNAELFVDQAIGSVLGQTYSEFEFLIIDDGSTDRTRDVIAEHRDSRIRLVRNDSNAGLVAALNLGLAQAAGSYVMRMDADDVALPERMRKQLEFMVRHKAVGISGTWSKTVGAVKEPWETRFPVDHAGIVAHLVFQTAISHPTAMLSMALLTDAGLAYDPAAKHAEDYDLWVRASKVFELANVPEVLLHYRVHDRQISKSASVSQNVATNAVRARMLQQMSVEASGDELALHHSFSNYEWDRSGSYYKRVRDWLRSLVRQTSGQSAQLSLAINNECERRLRELHAFVHPPKRLARWLLTKLFDRRV